MKNRALYDACSIQHFSLEEGTYIFQHPEEFAISKIYRDDQSFDRRLGYRFKVLQGMSQRTSELFTFGEARPALEKVSHNQGWPACAS